MDFTCVESSKIRTIHPLPAKERGPTGRSSLHPKLRPPSLGRGDGAASGRMPGDPRERGAHMTRCDPKAAGDGSRRVSEIAGGEKRQLQGFSPARLQFCNCAPFAHSAPYGASFATPSGFAAAQEIMPA